MALHFKFRSAVEYDSVDIEGHFISVASLKDKIVEAKNLGTGSDFDLLITNAQTGEDYSDDAFLVPKNTSVIIKRVPATRAKAVLRVDDQSKAKVIDQTGSELSRGADGVHLPPASSDAVPDSMDDFGVDLYAIPEPMLTSIGNDENSRIAAMVNRTAADWQRQTQEAYTTGGRGFGRLAYGRGISRGRGYGRAVPPQGYVCHRCGQPGHFIQHCPTNGDPTYDIRRVKLPVGIPKTRLKADQEGSYILPDGSVAVMQPDELVFAKEADALLSVRPTSADPPAELRCPLCKAIFKDGVMIPCCHYSFCDKCIRQELIQKGKCPQCGSSKFKNDDLLPNIALRQAIDRFLESQVTASSADEGPKLQQLPDLDDAPQVKAPLAAVSRLQIELRRPAVSMVPPAPETLEQGTSAAVQPVSVDDSAPDVEPSCPVIIIADSLTAATQATDARQSSTVVEASVEPQSSGVFAVQTSRAEEDIAVVHPTIVKDVSGSFQEGGTHPVIDDGGGMMAKMSDPPSHKEAEGVAVESEFSKGKKKKKRTRLITGDGVVEHMGVGKGKRMHGDRFCYICGSPEHLARDCLENPEVTHPPHPAMFGPGLVGLPLYGPDMYWHGLPMSQHGRPFPLAYGECMYGPGPGPIPFDAPIMPAAPYNAPPYVPPAYHGGPMHGGFMGGGMSSSLGPMDRPLSREEFMELQERERRRRLLQDRLHRDWSPERSFSRDGNMRPQTPDSERRRYELMDRRASVEEYHSLPHKREADHHSVRAFSDETEFYKIKTGKHEPKLLTLAENHVYRRYASNSDDDVSFDALKTQKIQLEKRIRNTKTLSISAKKESDYCGDGVVEIYSSDPDENLPQQSYTARRHEKRLKEVEVKSSKHHRQGHSIRSNDGKSAYLCVVGDNQPRGHRSKRNASVDGTHVVDYIHEEFPGRSGRHIQGQSRSHEQDGRVRIHDHSGSDVDGDEDVREAEKRRRRKHVSHSKAKIEVEGTVSVSEDDLKKKKKKHRKHRDEENQERGRDGKSGADGYHVTKHCKHRSRNGSHGIVSSAGDLEDTRWQLDSGHDESMTTHLRWSKSNKLLRSHNGKVRHV